MYKYTFILALVGCSSSNAVNLAQHATAPFHIVASVNGVQGGAVLAVSTLGAAVSGDIGASLKLTQVTDNGAKTLYEFRHEMGKAAGYRVLTSPVRLVRLSCSAAAAIWPEVGPCPKAGMEVDEVVLWREDRPITIDEPAPLKNAPDSSSGPHLSRMTSRPAPH